MTPNFMLIQSPSPDFAKLLTLSQQALGYNVAEDIDASPIERSDAERFLSCLAAMQERGVCPGFAPHLLSHVSFSVLVAADEQDMLGIVEKGEMPFVVINTMVRGVQLAVISGTLAQWKRMGNMIPRIREAFIANNLDVWNSDHLRLT
jgi:hypothetical protein